MARISPFVAIAVFAFGLTSDVRAQLQVDQNFTVEEYVNDILLGNGVTATNITYSGHMDQLGYATEGDGAFSISSGLVMSTDNSVNISCPDDFSFCDECEGLGVDDDLLDIANSVPGLIGQNFTVQDVTLQSSNLTLSQQEIRFVSITSSDQMSTLQVRG